MISRFLTGGDLSRIFCDAGLPPRHGVIEETARRLIRKALPPAVNSRDPSTVLARIADHPPAARWLAGLHPVWVNELFTALPSTAGAWATVPGEIADALEVLALRLASSSEDAELRWRSGNPNLIESPFHLLLRAVTAVAEALRKGDDSRTVNELVPPLLIACRAALADIYAHLERHGVSVAVVFRLDRMRQQLERIERLLGLCDPRPAIEERRRRALDFLAGLVRDLHAQARVRSLLSDNFGLLTRRVVDSASHTGEHYITNTAGEWRGMVASAAGGGALTAGTALMKVWVGWAGLPLFIEGAFNALNFSGSFLLMQALGLTLATKQPPMTAAALARAMADADGEQLTTLSARIVRSQLAAVLGNLGGVIVVAWSLDGLWHLAAGRHLLDLKTAAYLLHSLSPIGGGTLWYAAVTGVALWASSVVAGLGENANAYHGLPAALGASPRLRKWFGPARAERLGNVFGHHVGSICGNTALGVFLAVIPIIGKVTGVPLDVRHITLSTGALTLALCAGIEVTTADLVWALIGIACIGSLNFGVGFALSLAMAVRARGLSFAEGALLLWHLLRHALTHPGRYLFPPATSTPSGHQP